MGPRPARVHGRDPRGPGDVALPGRPGHCRRSRRRGGGWAVGPRRRPARAGDLDGARLRLLPRQPGPQPPALLPLDRGAPRLHRRRAPLGGGARVRRDRLDHDRHGPGLRHQRDPLPRARSRALPAGHLRLLVVAGADHGGNVDRLRRDRADVLPATDGAAAIRRGGGAGRGGCPAPRPEPNPTGERKDGRLSGRPAAPRGPPIRRLFGIHPCRTTSAAVERHRRLGATAARPPARIAALRPPARPRPGRPGSRPWP